MVSEPFHCVSTRSPVVAWRAAIGLVLRTRIGVAPTARAMSRKSASFSAASATSRLLLRCGPVCSIVNIEVPDEGGLAGATCANDRSDAPHQAVNAEDDDHRKQRD